MVRLSQWGDAVTLLAIISDADRAAANAAMDAAGYGPNNFNVAFSPSGLAPATHWGSIHGQDVYAAVFSDGAVEVREFDEGHLPEAVAAAGLALVAGGEV